VLHTIYDDLISLSVADYCVWCVPDIWSRRVDAQDFAVKALLVESIHAWINSWSASGYENLGDTRLLIVITRLSYRSVYVVE
jgi:hypothetical protein